MRRLPAKAAAVIADVSNNNGRIDWELAAPHLEGAIAKASEGETFRDSFFRANRAACRERGLLFGAYHYGRVGSDLPGQLGNFLAMMDGGPRPGELPPALDIEWEGNRGERPEHVRWFVLEFLERLEERIGVAPMLYSAPAYLSETGLDRVRQLGRFPLWLASWGRSSPPAPPTPWKRVTLWQFSSSERVPGFAGRVDGNRLLVPRERIVIPRPDALPGPARLPAWWKPWKRWRLAGAGAGRPSIAPRRIPKWAWARLLALIRRRKEGTP